MIEPGRPSAGSAHPLGLHAAHRYGCQVGVTRRAVLARAGLSAGALALGGSVRAVAAETSRIPYHGRYQGGVTTPQQARLLFQTFDATARSPHELRALLRAWTDAARVMCDGEPLAGSASRNRAPADTGEALGLAASRLTVTFGFGPSLFDGRYGVRARRPEALIDLPAFRGDRLDPARCGGDLAVQVCADDPQVALHAVRNLARIARHLGAARPRWSQAGFAKTPGSSTADETGRNLLGFKDGTNNLSTADTGKMDGNVWVGDEDGPAWMRDGSYLVVRRVRARIERWDESDLDEQEDVFGRRKLSGAPFGGTSEFDPVDPAKLPRNAHIALANPRRAGSEAERILRRGYNYADGLLPDGHLDAGLFFAAFQRDPRRQFVPIQRRLAAHDRLNEYIVHTGSAIFAVPPGVRRGGYVGETLFAA
jgi:deferrochelatase/peroxidase EfeB